MVSICRKAAVRVLIVHLCTYSASPIDEIVKPATELSEMVEHGFENIFSYYVKFHVYRIARFLVEQRDFRCMNRNTNKSIFFILIVNEVIISNRTKTFRLVVPLL